jgi:hypothetical protein
MNTKASNKALQQDKLLLVQTDRNGKRSVTEYLPPVPIYRPECLKTLKPVK